ncbi:hypothetical protein [Sphingomonas sp.]|uniref:hypothetical protein n=1 Tax=Sphingomonas sp. TaxID=28214 RepID=UPI00286BAA02|nr:hypothetical protein [Sphingomonas sp.]
MGLAASFASAWDEIGSPSLLASAAIMSLFAVYWSFGLFARDQSDDATLVAATVADAQEAEAEMVMPQDVLACEPEVLACEPEMLTEPEPVVAEPVVAEPVKRRARKAKKAVEVAAPLVAQPEPLAVAEPVFDGPPLEQLFDAQPFVRQARPAFGKKARGPRPVAVG